MAKKQKPVSASPARTASFTDTKRVQELIELMAANGLSEIELVEGEKKIALRRGVISGGSAQVAHAVHHAPAPVHAPASSSLPAAPPIPANGDETLIAIKSPMVGTFYSAANPDSDPFASVGTQVNPKTTVCIIEAMKVFNEIPAEVSGTITKVLVANGQAVEFGQPLFLVKPA